MTADLDPASKALLATLEKIGRETTLMHTIATTAAQGVRDGKLTPANVQQTIDLLTSAQGVDFSATLDFFAPAPAAQPVDEAGEVRYHLAGGAITLHTGAGLKTFGQGWLLVSEPEYARLKLNDTAASTVKVFQSIAEDRRLRAGKAAYEKYVAGLGPMAGRFPSWEIIGAAVQSEWCDRAERQDE